VNSIEVLPFGSRQANAKATPIYWHRFGDKPNDVISDCSWDLYELGDVGTAAGDLLRIATSAYLADRLTSRGSYFSRDIDLTVHIANTSAWGKTVMAELTSLLSWLTGDSWSIRLKGERRTPPPNTLNLPLEPVDEVTLLSGGLDSFCGAIDRIGDNKSRLFVGHTDGTAAVQRAQNELRRFLHTTYPGSTPGYQTVLISNKGKKAESSTRSRSLLFMALAAAIASGQQSGSVVVPENGFTSINLPLNTARGGALSTRSTHPYTFHRVNSLLHNLGLSITISNPYQQYTKGEFVKLARNKLGDPFVNQIAHTVSCGKLDGTYYKGGNPNLGCGLCVPCIIRRASIAAPGIADPTDYLSTRLNGDSLKKLLHARRIDTEAMNDALEHPIVEDDLLSCGPWPDDFDLSSGLALYNRGLDEIRLLDFL
jgi:7-cyano-7-deazaguanine synthase in queuosine biosynthesis